MKNKIFFSTMALLMLSVPAVAMANGKGAVSFACNSAVYCDGTANDFYADDCRPKIDRSDIALTNAQCGTLDTTKYDHWAWGGCDVGCSAVPIAGPPAGYSCQTYPADLNKDKVIGTGENLFLYPILNNGSTPQVWDCTKSKWIDPFGGGVWTKTGNNISNTNTGNVGIGTATPLYKLDVQGGYQTNSDYTSPTANQQAFMEGDDGMSYFGSLGSQPASFGNSEKWDTLTVDGGNVGIGYTDPGYPLDVNGRAVAIGLWSTDWIESSGDMWVDGGYLHLGGDYGTAIETWGDGWLRLNQNGDFSSGTHSPHNMNVSGLTVGPLYYDPGDGNIVASGHVSATGGFGRNYIVTTTYAINPVDDVSPSSYPTTSSPYVGSTPAAVWTQWAPTLTAGSTLGHPGGWDVHMFCASGDTAITIGVWSGSGNNPQGTFITMPIFYDTNSMFMNAKELGYGDGHPPYHWEIGTTSMNPELLCFDPEG